MSALRLTILWLQWLLLRRPSVVLIDHDGTMNARLVHRIRNLRMAKRYGLGVRNVRLLAGGGITGACYVTKWEPLFPNNFSI